MSVGKETLVWVDEWPICTSHERRGERVMHDEHIYHKNAATYEKSVTYGPLSTPANSCEGLFLLSLSKPKISSYYPG